MQPVQQLGQVDVLDWVCVNELCDKPVQICPKCKSEVLPESMDLGGVRYICKCGYEIKS
jgi:hypothetical protein